MVRCVRQWSYKRSRDSKRWVWRGYEVRVAWCFFQVFFFFVPGDQSLAMKSACGIRCVSGGERHCLKGLPYLVDGE